jgi:hypothetical protein
MNKRLISKDNTMKIKLNEDIYNLYKKYKNTYNYKELLSLWIKNKIYKKYKNFFDFDKSKKDIVYIKYNESIKTYKKYLNKELLISSNTEFKINSHYIISLRLDFTNIEKYWKNYWNDNWIYVDNSDLFVNISHLLPYYYLKNKYKTTIDKTDLLKIKKFLEQNWYQELTPELWETELDIVWYEFMPYDAWVEKAKALYKESYVDQEEDYFITKMRPWYYGDDKLEPNREKDFQNFCKLWYKEDREFSVKAFLFWNKNILYETWLEKAVPWYEKRYLGEPDEMYYIDEMDYWEMKKDREKDFEAYCKWEYPWAYKVKYLLFWESFIEELI